jgi:hypothetical protein
MINKFSNSLRVGFKAKASSQRHWFAFGIIILKQLILGLWVEQVAAHSVR